MDIFGMRLNKGQIFSLLLVAVAVWYVLQAKKG